MKSTSSLFAKILAWFFLNLIIVAATLALFFAFQPHVNLHSIFGQEGVNRLKTAGKLISHDLRRTPQTQWPEELARHAKIHQVDFMIVFEDGSNFASSEHDLPEEVMLRVNHMLRRKPPKRRPLPHDRIDPRRPHRRNKAEISTRDPALKEIPPPAPRRFTNKPNFRMKTKHPTRYWSGIRLRRPLSLQRPQPAVLLVVSDSITGKGFFFDPLPWIVVAVVVILLSALIWIPIVRNITRPLARMTRATEQIAKGRFNVLVTEPRSDEIGRLAKAISHMSSRLSAFVRGQKRFLGDVAHELGSPIARIQFGLGALEQRTGIKNRQRVKDVIDDVNHLTMLVNELLAFSRADLNAESIKLEKIDLLPVVETAVKREQTASVEIITRIAPQAKVMASKELLVRAIANLIRNAVKYAGDAGPIEIVAETRDTKIEM